MDLAKAAAFRPYIEHARQRMTAYWACRNTTPIIDLRLEDPAVQPPRPGAGWDHPEQEPDIPHLVSLQLQAWIDARVFGGDAIPRFEHCWGAKRIAPMALSFYYGSPLQFKETTTWTDHHLASLAGFDPVLDPGNRWWRISRAIIEEQHRQGLGVIHPCIPGIGDVMTNLSVMRGSEQLCQDLMDDPDRVHALRGIMMRDWVACYDSFAALGRGPGRCPGTCCWTGWAEGTTYPVQCDFSTMISNRMFRQFVLPELEFLSGHLTHMIWHLDGQEEFKHLDTLLALPYIKAIQWAVPPTSEVDDPRWVEMYKRVQAAGKSLFFRGKVPQLRNLLDQLSPRGLMLLVDGVATDDYLRDCRRYLGVVPWL